ncbi:hypothetical protein MW887_004612 [Aspergillus wentii]|nr:hypothetical protein MW887_004612 [Aspergillus wentii]
MADSSYNRLTAHSLSHYTSKPAFLHDAPVVDQDGFLISATRAGGPYLCSLPATCDEIFRWGKRDEAPRVEVDVQAILRDSKINYRSVQVTGRVSKVDPEPTPVPTVLVHARRRSILEDWWGLSRKIHAYVKKQLPGFCVEIIEDAVDIESFCYPVLLSDTIVEKWPTIRQTILVELQNQLWDWTALECWRFGRDEKNILNNPVTVIVSVLKRADRSFDTNMQCIRDILAYFDEPNVDVLFMKDESKDYVLLPEHALSRNAQPGVSIGIRNSSAGSSTLGGVVEVRFPGSPRWNPYGLTCFHCIYPPEENRENFALTTEEEECLSKWKLSPVEFSDPMSQKLLQVDHPSQRDLDDTIRERTRCIKAIPNDDFKYMTHCINEAEKESKQPHFTKRAVNFYNSTMDRIDAFSAKLRPFERLRYTGEFYLGEVMAGSGLHRTKPASEIYRSRRDWALIKMAQDRVGDNKPSVVSGFKYCISPDLRFNSASPIHPGLTDFLFKVGRSTDLTRGVYSPLEQVRIARERDAEGEMALIATLEHAITSKGEARFAEAGDSGSFIFTRKGDVVGMVMGGFERKNTVYFTPIQDVLDDIREVTGAEAVRLM